MFEWSDFFKENVSVGLVVVGSSDSDQSTELPTDSAVFWILFGPALARDTPSACTDEVHNEGSSQTKGMIFGYRNSLTMYPLHTGPLICCMDRLHFLVYVCLARPNPEGIRWSAEHPGSLRRKLLFLKLEILKLFFKLFPTSYSSPLDVCWIHG